MKDIFLRIIIGLSITTCTMFILNRVDSDNNESELLVKAFSESNFNLEETELNIWTTYKSKYYSPEEMESILFEIVDLLELEDVSVNRINTQENKVVEITKESDQSKTVIKFLEAIEQVEGDVYKAKNYIVVDIIFKEKGNSIVYFEKLIMDYFHSVDLESNVNIMIIGSAVGKLSNGTAKQIMYSVLNTLNGRITDAYTMENAISMYGYSDRIDNYIKLEDCYINIDMSTHYNELENKTYLYMATPVISRDF